MSTYGYVSSITGNVVFRDVAHMSYNLKYAKLWCKGSGITQIPSFYDDVVRVVERGV